ncbi:branched-chain amino acid ABC transporter permease [Pseudahrensia aquimaris]|uniref:Branched-chain amino acid ABC transporter permease n=1 Tax=Pseudahrensia aquimaris TaxID=744461 RepID=A0ABW3FC79_9HYPH
MRFVFKTSYDADIRLFKHGAQAFWYALLAIGMLGLPLLLSGYAIGEVTSVLILAIAGMGLMLLTGHTGLPSLGHAFFMALGCYANVKMLEAGVPWLIAFPLSGLIAGGLGALIALPVLRLHGVYLALATLALSILIADIIILAEPWTGGVSGIVVPDISIFGFTVNRFATPYAFYYVCLAVVVIVMLVYRNLLRAPLGRSFTAVRDSEISAQAMGINLTVTKTKALFLSATFAGLSGSLLGHSAGFVNSETFDLVLSITLLLMIVIGGLGFIHGAFLGAIVVGVIPVLIANGRTFLSTAFDININVPGLESGIFAAILIGFILFEPMGLYGRWLKVRTYFELFPFYRRDMFRRQKSYLKTERVR